MSDEPVRILVVDDTVTYRTIVSNVLGSLPGVEVVGTAAHGRIALQKAEQLRPDLMTLDLEMPEMDGLEVLRRLKAAGGPIGAIMLSAFTAEGAETTVAALKLGAFDFVLKPSGSNVGENTETLRRSLGPKIEAFARRRQVRQILTSKEPARPTPPPSKPETSTVADRMQRLSAVPRGRSEVVAIGVSTGGPQALMQMIPRLPGDLAVPVLIVQHMPPMFTKSLADALNTQSPLAVSEACEGDVVSPGRVLIAPGGKQMKVEKQADTIRVRITEDPPENSCRPSVDYLFRSVAHVYGARAAGVVMTGMGSDGALGARLMKRWGSPILAQDEASCVVYGMPKAVVDEGTADVVAPLDRIAAEIVRFVGKGVPACR